MAVALPGAPFPITYRELWLPPGIKGWTGPLPSCRHNGHGLAFTGARHGTTCDGVHGDGVNTGNINAGANAVDNAAVKYWVGLRFRPDTDWAAGDGDQHLWGKYVDATHYIRARLDSATGNLIFEKNEGGATFSMAIASPDGDAIWHAGTWYQALFSISNTAGARFKVNDADLQTDADLNPMPNGGDLCFLDYDDPGAGTGFIGIEVDIFAGTDNLTGAEETDLFKGIPPQDAVHTFPLDEGRGVTAYDRGSGADDGTLDTTATWKFGQVEQPVISLDGIAARCQSSAGLDISGDLTVIWAGKMKSTYTGTFEYKDIFRFRAPTAHVIEMLESNGGALAVDYYDGASHIVNGFVPSAIDEYQIIISTLSVVGGACLFQNGIFQDQTAAVTLGAAAATAYIGSTQGGAHLDVSKPLIIALIDGAFTKKQALAYSRYLKNVFNLPIAI